jgi:MFS transporter, DHA2 family, multidrug resistance protein
MAASYDGIAQSKTDQASALINAARNTGSSIGVSIVSNVLTHRDQFHQSGWSKACSRRASNIRTRCTG